MQPIEVLGIVAAILTTSAFVPQVYKAYKHKSTADISLTMYLVLLIGLILWLIYGVYQKSAAIILANAATGVLVVFMLVLKIRHK